MRPPRYRFSDEVRSTTRAIASRMVEEDTVARTPEELDTWLLQAPQFREALQAGGYDTAFTAEDLFPLLQAFVVKAGGSPPATGESQPPSFVMSRWLPALVIAVVIVVVVLAVVIGTRS